MPRNAKGLNKAEITINLQFVKNTISAKQNKAKRNKAKGNKTRYACM
jgi:hypothetical protein